MIKSCKVFLVIIAFFYADLTNAQYELKLTLTDAINLAKSGGPLAKSINSRAIASYWQYKSARASRLPSLSLNGNVPGINRTINSVTQPDGKIIFIPQSQAISSAALVLNQNILPTGGNIYFSSGLSRIDLLTDPRTHFWQSTPIVFGISQPIFRLNEQKWVWRQARLNFERSERFRAEQLEDLSIQVASRFFEVYYSENEALIAELNSSVNDTIYRISEGRYNLGKIAENELLQSELSLLNARNTMQQARIRLSNNENTLKNLLGIPQTTKIVLIMPDEIPQMQVSIDRAVAEARENRSDFISYDLNMTDAEMDLKRASANRFLNASLDLSYGLNQTSPDFQQVYKDPLSQQRFTVNFNIPLMSWGKNRADFHYAKSIYDAVKTDQDFARSTFDQEIITKVLEFQQLQTGVLLASKADTIANKRYQVTKNRYLIGKVDMTDLYIAQNEKDMARLNYIRNLQNLWIAYYQLRRLTLYDFMKNERII